MDKSSGGCGFIGLLTLLFIALKLTHQIDWSWVWVLAPLWGIIAIVGVVFIGIALSALLLLIVNSIGRALRRKKKYPWMKW